jgi:hypothetical protein
MFSFHTKRHFYVFQLLAGSFLDLASGTTLDPGRWFHLPAPSLAPHPPYRSAMKPFESSIPQRDVFI